MSLITALSDINPLAVCVAGIAHMATGLIWFQPRFFGRLWTVLTKQELKPASRWIIAGIMGHLLLATVLAVIVNLANATTMVEGFVVGFMIWIGVVVPLEVGELIWEKIPVKLFAIRIGNHLVALSIAGSILTIWR